MGGDDKLWADAFTVLSAHGDDALARVTTNINAAMLAGDDVAMLRWFEIFQRLEELVRTPKREH